MKRLLLVLFMLVSAANEGFAQQVLAKANKNISMDFNAPRSREAILRAISEGSVFTLVFDDAVPGDWSGKIFDVPIAQAIRQVLPPGYEMLTDSDLVIHIKKTRSTSATSVYGSQAAYDQRPTMAFAPMGRVHPCDLPNMYTIPRTYSPDLGYSEADWIMAASRMPCTASAPGPLITGSTYTGGYSGNYSRVWYPWMSGCANGPVGYIQFDFDGPSRDRKLWELYLNGERPGSITQGDRFWRKLPVCAGSVMVEMKKLGWGPTGIASHQDTYSVRPGATTKINVGDFLFELDSHTELKKHVLVEQ